MIWLRKNEMSGIAKFQHSSFIKIYPLTVIMRESLIEELPFLVSIGDDLLGQFLLTKFYKQKSSLRELKRVREGAV